MADAASVTDEPEVQGEKGELKYLEFVEGAFGQVGAYATKAYDYAKDLAGPLKPGVEKLETTLKTVAGPAIDKFVPSEILKFVDSKVDESVTQLAKVLPPIVIEVTTTAKSLSTEVISDVKNVGVVETAKGLIGKIEPVAEEYASSAWKLLNNLPYVTKVAETVAPAATLIADKYNETVEKTGFLPLVPTEKLAKVFTIPSESEAEPAAPAEEPAAPAEEPAAPAEEPAAPADEEPAAPAEEPEAPAEEPAAPAEEPEAPAEEPAAVEE